MSNITPLRKTIASHLGQVLTPEIAAEIELALELVPLEPSPDAKKHNDYDLETAEYMRHGLKLFQAVMLAETEGDHAKALYSVINAPTGATFVDMGCGVGELSRLFAACDPSAMFYSITNSETQAALTRHFGGSDVVLTDFHDTGLPDGVADVVMFNETWGYGDPQRLANEAFRLLKPDGRIFLKDWHSQSSGYSPEWDWHQWRLQDIFMTLMQAGFDMVTAQNIANPQRDRYQAFMQASELMQQMHPCKLRLPATPAFFMGMKP